MNLWTRWGIFNLVGVAGMGVQLAALAILNRIARGHYLIATAVAIELAVLHNFAWHLHTTWRDYRHRSGRTRQLLRFHLSNGLISMAGNLAIMKMLVNRAHVPVLAANLCAILTCSLVNFCVGHQWVFAAEADA